MAPILATATGVPMAALDEPLQSFLDHLNGALLRDDDNDNDDKNNKVCSYKDQELLAILQEHETIFFEEQVDLHQWIAPLNGMDAVLRRCLRQHPSILLLAPVAGSRRSAQDTNLKPATCMEDVAQVPPEKISLIRSILSFWHVLLRNATSKSIFQSVDELTDLLAAADDEVSDLALKVLQALSLPPALHKQQAPDAHVHHTTALHASQSASHARIVAAARGYGTRATGLGLLHLVLADDAATNASSSQQQQQHDDDTSMSMPSLPPEVGQVHFSFYPKKETKSNAETKQGEDATTVDDDESTPMEIVLTERDILLPESGGSSTSSDGTSDATSSKKRRRISKRVKSTAELFFLALEHSGGRVPENKLFVLLQDVRMALSYWTRKGRIAAVERRLLALTCMLYTHPSQDVMSGYFTAQPELCVELVDLLRPTVSAAAVTSSCTYTTTTASGAEQQQKINSNRHDGIAGLAEGGSSSIPYTTRLLALEALTALVSRRDGAAGGALSGSARLSSVLTELGVGKGSYLGTLPTLIRYALASLGTASAVHESIPTTGSSTASTANTDQQQQEDTTLDIGLAFVEATMAPAPPRLIQVQQALDMIDAVLTVASAVVATPSGTSALTDCGMIPALLTTVAMSADSVLERLLTTSSTASSAVSDDDLRRVKAVLRFVAAQAIQILEAAIVTHSNALTAYHDLDGVEVLTSRLALEISSITESNKKTAATTSTDVEDAMDVDNDNDTAKPQSSRIPPSQRVLLYSIVTCLTVVFHQETTSSASPTAMPSGGTQLRKKELTDAVIQIMDDVGSYGGHLASLVATLLSDVMNSDPHIVHYVHKSGIAMSFLNMVMGKTGEDGEFQPLLPAVPELVMAIPNVIAALSLTEDGAKVVKELNPFPSFLRIFYHPKYAMPNSRCLLNEMTAIVGTGLDEITRHVERLNSQVLVAVADAVKAVAEIAEDLASREEGVFELCGPSADVDGVAIENERTCLIQYVLNIGQLLEQILHNEDHCDPFVDAGGLDALLRLFPASMASGFQFLAQTSSLSAPSVSTLHHSTIEESLALAFKRIQFRYNPVKLFRRMLEACQTHLGALDESHRNLFGSECRLPFALDQVPQSPMYKLSGSSDFSVDQSKALVAYLRNVGMVQWITSILASTIKAVCQRSQENGTGWTATEREWKKAISEDSFASLTERLSSFYQTSLFEVCRLRTKKDFELDEKDRQLTRASRLRYRLRIVCPEGAVLRDGIEIDSCANVGSMEMGEIVDSFDRCINSCGILRYHTPRGWVSEVTRGHGREPIAEVISLSEECADQAVIDTGNGEMLKRVEASIPGLRMVAVGVLARGQIAYSELFGALSKLSIQSIRSLPVRTLSFSEGSGGEQIAGTFKNLSSNLEAALNLPEVITAVNLENDSSLPNDSISREGIAMYYGCVLNLLHACLFDDKRDRRMVNLPLLVSLVSSDSLVDKLFLERNATSPGDATTRSMGMFGACTLVFDEGILDFSRRAGTKMDDGDSNAPRQRVSRSVAASLPPLVSLLRRLVCTPLSSSPVASIMSRLKWKDVPLLLGRKDMSVAFANSSNTDGFFEPERFVSGLQVTVSLVVKKAWLSSDFVKAPPHLLHPVISLIGDVIVGLEDACKKKSAPTSENSTATSGFNLSDYFRQRRRTMDDTENAEEEHDEFEPDEAAVSLMADMGFDRDRALDALESTRSNRVEIAMEYALTHPPPSPTTIARRREERDARRTQRTQQGGTSSNNGREGETEDSAAAVEPNADSDGTQPEGTEQSQQEGTSAPPEAEKKENENDIFGAKAELESWIDDGPSVSCQVLASMDSVIPKTTDSTVGVDGNGEAEALTVVLSSFLLDLCHRYPEKRTKIVSQLLQHLKSKATSPQAKLTELENSIPKESEFSVAALCHAVVLFVRALPKTRVLILQQDLIGCLVAGIHTTLKAQGQPNASLHPVWMAPSLLLLDVMAQPVVAFSDQENSKDSDEEMKMGQEYVEVKAEHESQARQLSEMSRAILLALSDGATSDEKGRTSTDSAKATEGAGEVNTSEIKNEDKKEAPFESIPAYFPLLSGRYIDSCLDMCLKLLGSADESPADASIHPPPGVAQATLLLLLRLLRSPRNSSKCRHMGVAEAILGLPVKSKFTGNTGLVALIFRRLLEDETTLQTAMETEIRGTVAKLQAKKTSSNSDKPVSLHSFIEAVTPLLCRDPESFLKAMAVSIKVEPKTKDSPDPSINLLSADERARHASILAEVLKKHSSDENASKAETRRNSKSSSATRGRGKSPHRNAKRNSVSKKNKKEKHPRQRASSVSASTTETSATHITSLLMNAITAAAPNGISGPNFESQDSNVFLWVGNLLEILTDLVLAVPACACAVHNYRPHRSRDKAARSAWSTQLQHALSGCPNPPKTFVNCLLHFLLPQDRWSIRSDTQIWDRRKGSDKEDAKLIKQKRARAYRITKASQAAARVVLALVARPGEGRKRVISDLTFALSGGRLGHGALVTTEGDDMSPKKFTARELHALYAWGELCLGVAAPRCTGKNIEGLASLNIENIRLMLETGMVHALLYAIHRVRLFHPMASSTCGALLIPLECLTRATVAGAVKKLVANDKNTTKDSQVGEMSLSMDISAEINVEEPIVADADVPEGDGVGYDEILTETEENEMDEDGGDSAGMEIDEAGDNNQSDDEELSSAEGSEEGSEEDASSDDDESEDTDMDDADSDEDEGSSEDDSEEDEVEEEGDWNVDYNDDFVADNQAEQPTADDLEDEEEEDGTERLEQGLEEGWTRIESSAFGGMLLAGGRGNLATIAGSERGNWARGFVDAAEAMIGSLLRNGEISNETLAELEGSLGIRIMNARSVPPSLGADGGAGGDTFAVRVLGGGGAQPEQGRRGEIMGTLPHIHQRSQPDVGYSAFGSGGRWADISSMEYVYGGPSVTAGSRNYDLISGVEEGSDADAQPQLTQLDLQLFPGGPAAASNARTQHSLHPLLCGVDLPPVNALVSDLLPHGVRATRFGQMTTRRPGDWTNAFSPGGYLVSTSNGNIIRSNRSHSGAPLGSGMNARNVVGPVGWTDDGLPVDATVEEFSSAFERAVAETTASLERSSENEGQSNDSEEPVSAASNVTQASEHDSPQEVLHDDTTGANSGDVSMTNADAPVEGSGEGSPPAGSQQPRASDGDGDGVASSLAEGLRLSPGSEPDAMSTTNPTGEDADRSEQAGAPSHSSLPNAAETEPTEEVQHEENSHPEEQATNDESQDVEGDVTHSNDTDAQEEATTNGLVCPPDIDLEVFNSLPLEMQQDCVNQYNATQELVAQLDGSTLDPEVLAALPEDMRQEVIEQDRRERRMREQAESQADPAHAEEMDNASFVASLSPDLREEILLTADEAFLSSLPPSIVAEAQVLRDRVSTQQAFQQREYDEAITSGTARAEGVGAASASQRGAAQGSDPRALTSRKKARTGKMKVECDREHVTYLPESLPAPLGKSDLTSLIRLMYLLSPVRPPRLLQKVFQNIFSNPDLRIVASTAFVQLLHENGEAARNAVGSLVKYYSESDSWRRSIDEAFPYPDFPPTVLIGSAPNIPDSEAFNLSVSASLLRHKQGISTAAAIAANLPSRGKSSRNDATLPPVVAARFVDTLLQLCKSSPRFCLHVLVSPVLEQSPSDRVPTCFELLLDLLDKPLYSRSSANLDQLLSLLESAVSPLSYITKIGEADIELSQREIDSAAAAGKEWTDAPRVTISQSRLQMLCSILRMETCRDTCFTKVNTIVRRLCRVEMNRGYVLAELASVAHGLGADAIRDLRALKIRMDGAASQHQLAVAKRPPPDAENESKSKSSGLGTAGHISSSVTLSTSSSELKLLRVLQTLQSLCGENWDESSSGKKSDVSVIVTEELVHLLRQLEFNDLWDELSSCLSIVQVLEGVKALEDEGSQDPDDMDTNEDAGGGGGEDNNGRHKKLRNSAAGLLTRFLPAIEAFFVANASATRPSDKPKDSESLLGKLEDIPLENLVGGKRLLAFAATNKVILNALVRNNPSLLDKGFRALVQVPPCRAFLDFDVKRQWFKTQVRRLRQHASRRHGSLRLHIRRKYVFEDAYHQLRLRNADEMRGRLHITFRNEEGVDAGGLSREFFGILAKEIFNPNYALFTSTEDGCTFQPNSNSSINPDHLSYFRFVGRIVGKAVADGFLLDAHFTRSLYKHMLGLKPTHDDMEAIDPDYYRNLKTILEFNLADIGLELTFSIEDHSFGRSQTIDLLPNGRTVHVTEESKEEYVRLVCQHRMTTAIQSQIKAYLDGFYELVSPELIAIFTPRELELLISGLPDIDVHDLKKNTDYVGWKATDKEIEWFWNILHSLSRSEKASFLQFVTGSSKVPLAGFSELQGMRGVQKFSIHKTTGGKNGALMSAHTCFNSLDLPNYNSENEMREKLLYAVNEGGGGFLFA